MASFIGILMLDTAFARIVGDVGNPESYDMPVRLLTVPGADVTVIVRNTGPDPQMVDAFIAGARQLEREGAAAILTSCGFMIHAQQALAASVAIPVVTSALCLGPMLRATTQAPIGVLTADAGALGTEAIRAAGLEPQNLVIAGMEGSALWRRIILTEKAAQARTFDRDALEAEIVARARALIADAPEIGAILLECGNLPPYAEAIRAATGKRVWSILDVARLLDQ